MTVRPSTRTELAPLWMERILNSPGSWSLFTDDWAWIDPWPWSGRNQG